MKNIRKLKSKNVIVTGGPGFIGSNLVNELMQRGHHVAVIDNLSSGKKENIHPKATFYLAAYPLVDQAYKGPFKKIETNVMGTVNVLEICRKRANLEAIIVISSDKAYGKCKKITYQEHFPLKGDHPYDVSKSAADLIAQTYFSTYHLPIAITRFSNVYGPGDLN